MKQLFTLLLLIVCCTGNAQEYLKLGDACYTKKDYACAYDNYMKGYEAKLDAKKDVLYHRIGYCLLSLKRYEEARPWFRRSLNEKENLNAAWDLASACYNLKKYDSSAVYYVKAFSLATTAEQKRILSYWAGYSYFNLKNYTQASVQVAESRKQDSLYAPAYTLSGRIAAQQKDYALAEKEFNRALLYQKDSVQVSYIYKQLGELQYNQKKYRNAIPAYLTGYNFNTKDTRLLPYTGDAYHLLKQADTAEYYYKKGMDVLLAEPEADSSFIGTVAVAMITNRILLSKDTLKALQYLPVLVKYDVGNVKTGEYLDILRSTKNTTLLESLTPVYAASMTALNKKGEVSYWYWRLGDVYRDLNQPQKAFAAFRSGLLADPTDYLPMVAMLDMLMNDKKYKEVIDTVNKRAALLSTGNTHLALLRKAEAIYRQKDTAAAAKIFRDILVTSSANYHAGYFLGLMALQRKDTATCAGYWEKIMNTVPYFNKEREKEMALPLYQFIGMRYFVKGSLTTTSNYYFTTASTFLDKALSIDSMQPTLRIYAGVSGIQAAKMYTGKSHLLKAVNLYLKKPDTLGIIYRWLAYSEMKDQSGPKYSAALDYYQKGTAANPKDSAIVSDMATAYYQQKDYAKAAETFGKMIGLVKDKNNQVQAYYNRGLCYYMNKQVANAIADVTKVLEMAPQHPDAKKLKAELEKPGG